MDICVSFQCLSSVMENLPLLNDLPAKISSDLTRVRKDLKRQIRRSSKLVMNQERGVLRMKKSVVALKQRKKNVENCLQSLAAVKNESISFSSSDEVDSDMISSDSELSSLDDEVRKGMVAIVLFHNYIT